MINKLSSKQLKQLSSELRLLKNRFDSCSSKEEKNSILIDINTYIEILVDLFDMEGYQEYINLGIKNNINDIIKSEYSNILNGEIVHLKNNINFYYNLINNILNVKNEFKDLYTFNSLTKCSLNDLITLVNDYYPLDFKRFFNEEINSNRLLLIYRAYESGICFTISNLENKYYYICEKKFEKSLTYYDLLSIIHEMTHGYVNKLRNNKTSIYGEVYSIFNELLLNNIIYDLNIARNDNQLFDLEFINNYFYSAIALRNNLKNQVYISIF